MKIMNYNKQLDELFDKWESLSKQHGYTGFCRDGLMYKGDIWESEDKFGRSRGNENDLWSKCERRIAFLMKDTNDNPNQDYREWLGRQNTSIITHKFFKNIALWLYGLHNIDSYGNFPEFSEAFNSSTLTKTFDEKPFAIVNCKKESGVGSIKIDELYNYVSKFGTYLREQLDILQPNIIICGGKGVVINIAKQIIFSDFEFEKINNLIYYNENKNIILADCYHPSARISYDKCYNYLMGAFKEFISLRNGLI